MFSCRIIKRPLAFMKQLVMKHVAPPCSVTGRIFIDVFYYLRVSVNYRLLYDRDGELSFIAEHFDNVL